MTPLLAAQIVLTLFIFVALLSSAAAMVWVERRVAALLQQRRGPTRVGWQGLLQPFADVIKLMFKEELRPRAADPLLFALAPIISATAAFSAFAVVPFGASTTLFGLLDAPLKLQVSDVNVAVLVIFAIGSMGVYGIVLAGWASNSKYPLLGGLRSSAQMISYELAQGISLVGVILMTGTLSLTSIVRQQEHMWFIVPQFFAFVIYVICGVAETNRAPFDLPEAETELVAGFHTEYSGIKFAMFYLGEYVNTVTVAAIAVTLFLGGWRGPHPDFLLWLWPLLWFLFKVTAVIYVYILVRGTLPRMRYDRLMNFGWKRLIPFGLVWVLVTGFVVAAPEHLTRKELFTGAAVVFGVLVLGMLIAPLFAPKPKHEQEVTS
jgi:NADH-quinone oxidoreductase subunit H